MMVKGYFSLNDFLHSGACVLGKSKELPPNQAMRSVIAGKNRIGIFDVPGSHVPEKKKSLSEK